MSFVLGNGFAKIEALGLCPEGIRCGVKCPNCGFVSFSGLNQCKRCGHQFRSTADLKGASLALLPLSKSSSFFQDPIAPDPPISRPLESDLPIKTSGLDSASQPDSAPAEPIEPIEMAQIPLIDNLSSAESERPWRDELSERVADFRRRRANLRGGSDPSSTLEFNFEKARGGTGAGGKFAEASQTEREFDFVLGRRTGLEREIPALGSIPLNREEEGETSRGAASMEAGEWPLGTQGPHAIDSDPVPIVMECSPAAGPATASESGLSRLPVAPLGRRFLAGLVDFLVLLLAAGWFAFVFWRTGGHIHLRPANVVVLAFIAGFLIVSYFGLFSAVPFSTPGQFSAGLAVRGLDGTFPTARQSLWRAFGYLVSIAALMLGFIWALVDSDGLTWHDRMSGTFLVDSRKSTVNS